MAPPSVAVAYRRRRFSVPVRTTAPACAGFEWVEMSDHCQGIDALSAHLLTAEAANWLLHGCACRMDVCVPLAPVPPYGEDCEGFVGLGKRALFGLRPARAGNSGIRCTFGLLSFGGIPSAFAETVEAGQATVGLSTRLIWPGLAAQVLR